LLIFFKKSSASSPEKGPVGDGGVARGLEKLRRTATQKSKMGEKQNFQHHENGVNSAVPHLTLGAMARSAFTGSPTRDRQQRVGALKYLKIKETKSKLSFA
jgi:hypothetical protein